MYNLPDTYEPDNSKSRAKETGCLVTTDYQNCC